MTTVDYVIVGAGSAGCVLANRLTEDPATTVLLLEAGGPDTDPRHRVPSALLQVLAGGFDWGYLSSTQTALGKPVAVPRGRGLGGSSAVNANVYLRGNPADYDGWASEHGATGWGWADVLPYFLRSEANGRLGSPLHRTDGPLHVEDPVYVHPAVTDWLASAVAAGIARTEDFNGVSQLGAGLYQSTVHDGIRWSAADAYLRPALTRPNLTVVTGVHVIGVRLDGDRARGVDYRDRDGRTHTVHADAETILCAGAIDTPALLLRSGIGPTDHLSALGIDVRHDLPGVGTNLQDHPAVPHLVYIDAPDVPALAETPSAQEQFAQHRRGPMASTFAEAGALISLHGSDTIPDVQFMVGAVALGEGLPPLTGPTFTNLVVLLHPRSRGTVRLRSAEPGEPPVIDPGIYADPRDLDDITAGLRIALDLTARHPFAGHVTTPLIPTDLQTNDFGTTLHRWTQTAYHPVATCAMGTGPLTVVDPTLRVHGIAGLRIADASVMPTITRANTHGPTVMIAEKAADLIRGRAPATT